VSVVHQPMLHWSFLVDARTHPPGELELPSQHAAAPHPRAVDSLSPSGQWVRPGRWCSRAFNVGWSSGAGQSMLAVCVRARCFDFTPPLCPAMSVRPPFVVKAWHDRRTDGQAIGEPSPRPGPGPGCFLTWYRTGLAEYESGCSCESPRHVRWWSFGWYAERTEPASGVSTSFSLFPPPHLRCAVADRSDNDDPRVDDA
jgi:hypothetical protein